mmetsp:Transcript_42880/g.73153  ORF Transcript_42880/g.73153 Transcript_42880/m.73153 type:complete len:106 (-) Transcript_42880:972-1289(-)
MVHLLIHLTKHQQQSVNWHFEYHPTYGRVIDSGYEYRISSHRLNHDDYPESVVALSSKSRYHVGNKKPMSQSHSCAEDDEIVAADYSECKRIEVSLNRFVYRNNQ